MICALIRWCRSLPLSQTSVVQNFRRLRVWKRAQGLAVAVRTEASGFPQRGFSDLRGQMVRAAESVFFNIGEGCGAESAREFARFLSISSKSTMELESQLELAKAYGIISPEASLQLAAEVSTVRRMIWGLRTKVLASSDVPKTETGKRKTENAQ